MVLMAINDFKLDIRETGDIPRVYSLTNVQFYRFCFIILKKKVAESVRRV